MCSSKKLFYLLFLAVFGLGSCSQSEDIVGGNAQDGGEQNGEVNVVFRLQSNIASTVTRGVEDSNDHTQGSPDEYKVNFARVYLYDNPTKLFVKSFLLTDLTNAGSDQNYNVIYESKRVSVQQGVYDIFVTANSTRVINREKESDFLADIDSVSYSRALITDISNGIVMSNRASMNVAETITNSSTDGETPVVIQLERVLARLDVAKSQEVFHLTDDNSVQYADVTLDGFYIVNLPKYFYTLRHTAVLTTLEEPKWNLASNFGNVSDVNGYVIDPYFFQKKVDASNFTNADKYYENFSADLNNPTNVRWMSFEKVSNPPTYKTSYCLENCALVPAQKNGYSTGVVFRAKVEPKIVYQLNNGVLEQVTNPANFAETLYYYDHKFYNSAAAFAQYLSGIPESSTNPEKFMAKKFDKTDEGYRCFYNYWIRHLDNYKDTAMGVMEFAIVRNNLYKMCITNVSDLGYGGTGVIDINPDTPDEGETYLKIQLNVKPWVIRDLTNIIL